MLNEIDKLREIKSIGYFIDNTKHPQSIRLKLADFYYRTKNLQNVITVDESKKKIIDEILKRCLDLKDVADNYLAGSPISAVKKAQEVLRQLAKKKIDLTNYGFINLGGGQGVELFTELENSCSDFGLLIEYDFNSVKEFRKNQIPFQLKNSHRSIETEVIECDLLDSKKLDIAKKIISEKKLDGIVVTIHAVLHELSTRSSFNFDMEVFFKHIYDFHDNIILIIREPGIPENWDDQVYITVDTKYFDNFCDILEKVNGIHFSNKETNRTIFATGEILIDKRLAIEALTKLFYNEDLSYELREQVSSMDQEKITKSLQASKFENIESEAFYTDSLTQNIEHYGVTYKGKDQKIISKPHCFTYTISTKGSLKIKQ